MKSDFERVLLYGNDKMNITYMKILNPEELKAEFRNKVEKKIKEIETKDRGKDTSTKKRLKPDGVEITWKDEKLSFEKADRISFDDKKIYIEYENETVVIPLKNIKKLRFPTSLTKLKQDWTWNSNLGYYDTTTNVTIPSWYINYKVK